MAPIKPFSQLRSLSLKIADIEAKIFLFLVYWFFIPPLALFFKKKLPAKNSLWSSWTIKSETLEDLKKQF